MFVRKKLKKKKEIKKNKTTKNNKGIKTHLKLDRHRNFVENFGGWRTFHFRVIYNITYTIGMNRRKWQEKAKDGEKAHDVFDTHLWNSFVGAFRNHIFFLLKYVPFVIQIGF